MIVKTHFIVDSSRHRTKLCLVMVWVLVQSVTPSVAETMLVLLCDCENSLDC